MEMKECEQANIRDTILDMALEEVFMVKLSAMADPLLEKIPDDHRPGEECMSDQIISLVNQAYEFGVRVGSGLGYAFSDF